MFVSRMEKERKNDAILEGMAVAVVVYATFFFFLSFFCPPVFFTTKVNVTNGQRSIGPNDLVLSETRVLSPRCEEDRNPADGEIARTGWKRSKGMDRTRTRMVRRKLLPDSP